MCNKLSRYFFAGFQRLVTSFNVEVHVVRWPVHKDAPFVFKQIPGVHFYEREKLSGSRLAGLAETVCPDLIYCAGWRDWGYLDLCVRYRNRILIILGLDNQWTGAMRQKVMTLCGKGFLRARFSHAWVPGNSQREYALRLGFSEHRILTGLYAADTVPFREACLECKKQKLSGIPKRFLYVGRLVEEKGIPELLQAFVEVNAEAVSPWELWLAGEGPLKKAVPQDGRTKALGFMTSEQLAGLVKDAGVFILPSRFEPWGVVLHEFAAAGMPLICSDAVGAKELFVQDGKNGFLHEAGDKDSLKTAMIRMLNLSDEELTRMGELSAQLSEQVSPDAWARMLANLPEEEK